MSLYLASVAMNPDLEQGTCFCDVDCLKPRILKTLKSREEGHMGTPALQS
jgi:hypothetical protein